jgi:prepilin-type N-terminal cleavage/methylation domain-containing protein
MKQRNERGVTLLELLVAMTLLGLLSTGIYYAFRVGLNAMNSVDTHVMRTRRSLGSQQALRQMVANYMPTIADCQLGMQPGMTSRAAFFQAEAQSLRMVTTWSMEAGARGVPLVMELAVVPGADGRGVRLILNERPYRGPFALGMLCGAPVMDRLTGLAQPLYAPIAVNGDSLVVADRLQSCRFLYQEDPQVYGRPDVPTRWLPRWPGADWPHAVKIEMVALPDEERNMPVATLALPLQPRRTL